MLHFRPLFDHTGFRFDYQHRYHNLKAKVKQLNIFIAGIIRIRYIIVSNSLLGIILTEGMTSETQASQSHMELPSLLK